MHAYVFVKVSTQATMSLMAELEKNENVDEASLIHGPYDCILLVHGPDLEAIHKNVFAIRAMPGVSDTLTSLIVQSWHRNTKR